MSHRERIILELNELADLSEEKFILFRDWPESSGADISFFHETRETISFCDCRNEIHSE